MKTLHKTPSEAGQTKPELVFDVVCGMELEKDTARCQTRYHEEVYYFCSSHCRQHFENMPTRYVWEK